jgi:hypothetical protein
LRSFFLPVLVLRSFPGEQRKQGQVVRVCLQDAGGSHPFGELGKSRLNPDVLFDTHTRTHTHTQLKKQWLAALHAERDEVFMSSDNVHQTFTLDADGALINVSLGQTATDKQTKGRVVSCRSLMFCLQGHPCAKNSLLHVALRKIPPSMSSMNHFFCACCILFFYPTKIFSLC